MLTVDVIATLPILLHGDLFFVKTLLRKPRLDVNCKETGRRLDMEPFTSICVVLLLGKFSKLAC